MFKSLQLFFKGTTVLIFLLRSADCQMYKTDSYEYKSHATAADSSIQHFGSGNGAHTSPGKSYENNNILQNYQSSYSGGSSIALTDKRTVSTGDPRIMYAGGSPVIEHGSSVVLRSPATDSERFVIDDSGILSTGIDGFNPASSFSSPGGPSSAGPAAETFAAVYGLFAPGGPFSSLSQFSYPGSFVNVHGLLRLLFGQAVNPFDRYLSFCNRITVVGRFLRRLFEPLLTTGFFMAASYFLRRTILPRIAHYIHVYTMMKDHDDARLLGGPFRDLNVLSAVVNDAINNEPCFQKIVCEAGLKVSSISIGRSIQRVVKKIASKNKLATIFKESFTGSISECSQYTCKKQDNI